MTTPERREGASKSPQPANALPGCGRHDGPNPQVKEEECWGMDGELASPADNQPMKSDMVVKVEWTLKHRDTMGPMDDLLPKQVAIRNGENEQEEDEHGLELDRRIRSYRQTRATVFDQTQTENQCLQATPSRVGDRSVGRTLASVAEEYRGSSNRLQSLNPGIERGLQGQGSFPWARDFVRPGNNANLKRSRNSSLQGNKNATKLSRRVELGWKHNGRQVRGRHGGGTRGLVVSKNSGYDDLVKIGCELFFPDGYSTKGPATDFHHEIQDFAGTVMPREATVGSLYEPLNCRILRVYLCTSEKTAVRPECQPQHGSEDRAPLDTSFHCDGETRSAFELNQCKRPRLGDSPQQRKSERVLAMAEKNSYDENWECSGDEGSMEGNMSNGDGRGDEGSTERSIRAQDRESNLMERLAQREPEIAINPFGKPTTETRRFRALLGNKNASKLTRRIELGWKHNGRQVRGRHGGGTQGLVVSKDSGYDDLIKIGCELFFPDGYSTKGPATDFHHEIQDFAGTVMPREATVGSLYGPVGLLRRNLRLYLSTTECAAELEANRGPDSPVDVPRAPQDELPLDADSIRSQGDAPRVQGSHGNGVRNPVCQPGREGFDFLSQAGGSLSHVHQFEIGCSPPGSRRTQQKDGVLSSRTNVLCNSINDQNSICYSTHPDQEDRSDIHKQCLSDDESTCHTDHQRTLYKNTQTVLLTGESKLKVECPVSHMIEQFKSPSIMDITIDVPEHTEDAYSSFWASLLPTDMDTTGNHGSGTLARVPNLRPDFRREEWEAVGRILLKGYRDHGLFPVQLPLASALCVVYGEEQVPAAALISSLLRCSTKAQHEALSSALVGGEYKMDHVLSILQSMCAHPLPEYGTLEDKILSVAHQRLIQEPMYALSGMARTAQEDLRQLLPNAAALTALYET